MDADVDVEVAFFNIILIDTLASTVQIVHSVNYLRYFQLLTDGNDQNNMS